jgi:hypothetical protein
MHDSLHGEVLFPVEYWVLLGDSGSKNVPSLNHLGTLLVVLQSSGNFMCTSSKYIHSLCPNYSPHYSTYASAYTLQKKIQKNITFLRKLIKSSSPKYFI